jgi:hypothetical protein
MLKPRNIGRPLAASEAQVAKVLSLREQRYSLRAIVDETNLGLATVRTIVGRKDGTDRTSIKHLSKIDPERARIKVWQAKERTRQAMPKRLHKLAAMSEALRKEVKAGSKR